MKQIFLYLFLLSFTAIFAQTKWNFGLVAGGSSKLRMGIPHKETIGYSGYSTTTIDIYPFEAFLNGGISARYHLNEKHFLQADLMAHRMDISSRNFYSNNRYSIAGSWNIFHTSFRFLQMPITYNWAWSNKRWKPFVGVGIAPSYIFAATNTDSWGGGKSYSYSLMKEHELQGIRHLKMPVVCEVGFQPLPHTVISFRSSLGVYRRFIGDYASYCLGRDVAVSSQNTNMFSLMAKVYLRK